MTTQEIIFDMKTIRDLSRHGIIVIDEDLRGAGKAGAEAGEMSRNLMSKLG